MLQVPKNVTGAILIVYLQATTGLTWCIVVKYIQKHQNMYYHVHVHLTL